MEKHFLMVIAGKARPATQEENEWNCYRESSELQKSESTKPDAFEAVKKIIKQADSPK